MIKTLFMIPGFGESASSTRYKRLIATIKQSGYLVQKVPIQWKYRVMSDYISEFKNYYEKYKTGNDYILGFSYGAVIAFSTAEELKPKKIFLCSLSNTFKEDIRGVEKKVEKFLGKKGFADIQKRRARQIAQNLTIPTILFYGEKEQDLKNRAEETARLAKKTQIVVVKNADHEINLPEYISAVQSKL